ncbi:MAG: CPBP family intramembrane metalloprotease, partial [Methyloversatilis sp.]|nr:CPBP family intramembrane metalloprotease [Methyloversatilis sp.]
LQNFLQDVPNLFGIPGAGIRLAGLVGTVSRLAFPAALLISSFSFATAHIAAWGFSPVVYSVHLALGMTLAYLAYRTRGMLVPFLTHFLFNLGTIAVGIMLPLALLPTAASVTMTLAGVFSVAFLWYNYRLHRKAKAAAIAEAQGRAAPAKKSLWRRALTALLIAPLLFGAFTLSQPDRLQRAASLKQPTAAQAAPTSPFMLEEVQKLLNVHAPKAAESAPAAEKKELSTVEITQRAKPA